MRIAGQLALLILSAIAIAQAQTELRAGAILSEIKQHGAKAVARRLYDNPEAWSTLLKRVASGAPAWLKVAKRLRPGVDAGSSNMLEISIFYALGSAPRDTLGMMSPEPTSTSRPFSVEGVCSSNFLIDYPATQSALPLVDERIAVLQRVGDPKLAATRELCLKGLEQARRDTLRNGASK